MWFVCLEADGFTWLYRIFLLIDTNGYLTIENGNKLFRPSIWASALK